MSIVSLRHAPAGPHATPAHSRSSAGTIPVDLTSALGRLPLVGLLTVQAAIGYEWFMSGLTKIVRGDFPSGLGAELTEKSEGVTGWYRTVLDKVLIPNATAVGYVTEIAELLVGVVLIAAAALLVFAPARLGPAAVRLALGATALAALAALLMNINFHLANASAHPWLIPADGFDEGVDLDSLMPLIESVILVVSVLALRRLRESRPTTR